MKVLDKNDTPISTGQFLPLKKICLIDALILPMIILEDYITSPSVPAVEQSCTSNGGGGANGGQGGAE
jgi:hypothetical protein